MNQKEVAQMAGISHGILSEIENGVAVNLDFTGPVNQVLRRQTFKKLRQLLDVLEGAA